MNTSFGSYSYDLYSIDDLNKLDNDLQGAKCKFSLFHGKTVVLLNGSHCSYSDYTFLQERIKELPSGKILRNGAELSQRINTHFQNINSQPMDKISLLKQKIYNISQQFISFVNKLPSVILFLKYCQLENKQTILKSMVASNKEKFLANNKTVYKDLELSKFISSKASDKEKFLANNKIAYKDLELSKFISSEVSLGEKKECIRLFIAQQNDYIKGRLENKVDEKTIEHIFHVMRILNEINQVADDLHEETKTLFGSIPMFDTKNEIHNQLYTKIMEKMVTEGYIELG